MSDSITNPVSPAVEAAAPTDLDAVAAEVNETLPEADVDTEDTGEDLGLDSNAAIDAAQKAGEISKKEAQQLKKTLKLKVDGQEFEETLDFNDEEGLKRMAQRAKAYDKRAQEAALTRSQMEQLVQMLQNDPESVLEKLGYNVDEFAQKRLEKQIENMRKTPEQVEREKMAKELEDLRKEKLKAEEDRKMAEMEKMRNQQAQQIENDISEALEASKSVLPKKNPTVLRRIAEAMYFAVTNGYPQVTAKDVLPTVEKQWQQEMNEFFSEAPEDVLEKLVGKAALDKYRKSKIKRNKDVKTTTANQVVKDTGVNKKANTQEEPSRQFKKMDRFWKI